MSLPNAVLDRARKLLALAGSPNPHEAAAAAARANALIREHRLEAWLADEQLAESDPIEDDRAHPIDAARRIRPWRAALAGVLASANGCLAYTLATPGRDVLVLVGRADDRAAVRVLWDALVHQIEWLSATHGPSRDRRWHEAFRLGVVDAVRTRLSEPQPLPDALSVEAIARIGPAQDAHQRRLDAFAERHLRLSRGRGLPVDPRAVEKGRKAGADLPLPSSPGPQRVRTPRGRTKP